MWNTEFILVLFAPPCIFTMPTSNLFMGCFRVMVFVITGTCKCSSVTTLIERNKQQVRHTIKTWNKSRKLVILFSMWRHYLKLQCNWEKQELLNIKFVTGKQSFFFKEVASICCCLCFTSKQCFCTMLATFHHNHFNLEMKNRHSSRGSVPHQNILEGLVVPKVGSFM